MYYKIFTIIGLLLDVAGVIMLFRYGLPSKVLAPPSLGLMEGLSQRDKSFNKRIRKWAYIGLFLLIIGFICQLIGVILQ